METKTPTATTPAQLRPADLAKAINDKLSQMVSAARTSFTRAIEIGELLKQAKDTRWSRQLRSVGQRPLPTLLPQRSSLHEAGR